MHEYDHRHFRFERFTGLPRGYFEDPQTLGHFVVGALCTAIAVVLLTLAAIGALS